MKKLPQINICAQSNRNGLSLTLGGILGLYVLYVIGLDYWQTEQLPLMFLILACFVAILIGLLKLIEPKYSFVLSPKTLQFIHRKGKWSLPWQAIKNIYPVKNVSGIESEELDYVGLSLTNIDEIATRISPRLANHLIHEQRPILLYCVSRGLVSIEEIVVNFNEFELHQKKLKGPVAGFLHQCAILHHIFGAHLFLPQVSMDRPLNEFARLLRECKASHQNYLPSH